MRKISDKQDWNDFIDDVYNELGKRGGYAEGHFAASLTGDDLNDVGFTGDFYAEFQFDADGFRNIRLSFKEYERTVWKDSDDFFRELIGDFKKPFYVCDPDGTYNWL